MDRITCIIPTRNRQYLAVRAVMSVINTNYNNMEIIVVDDGSQPPFFLPKKITTCNSIKLVRLESSVGGATARNVGVQHSTGEFISFLDDDDELLPNKYELLLPLLKESYNVDAVVAECIIIDIETGNTVECSNQKFSKYRNTVKNRIHTNATLIRRNVFQRIDFCEKLNKFQDMQFHTDLCYLFRVFHVNIPVAKWYVKHSDDQITAKKGIWFNTKNYFFLVQHLLFSTKVPVYLMYEHLLRLSYMFLRLK